MKLLQDEVPERMSPQEYVALSFRFIGIQTKGITVSFLREQFRHELVVGSKYDFSDELLTSLFFVSHERYLENQSLFPLCNKIKNSKTSLGVNEKVLYLLNKFYKFDIKLNQFEGLTLFESISGMNSAEFEGLGLRKEDCITKLLKQLEKNKFATFKFFSFRTKKSITKWPFLYALDTAEYLAQDPIIAATYHDDLLLFSGLINSTHEEAYFHARFHATDATKTPRRGPLTKKQNELVMSNLKQVEHYLREAATAKKPNNLQYAIQVIINSNEYISYAGFLKVCGEIKEIKSTKFDSKKVDEILHQNDIVVRAELPEIFNKDNADLKEIMILLIIALEEVKTKPLQTVLNEEIAQKEARAKTEMFAKLASLSIAELQVKLDQLWREAGILLSITGKIILNQFLKTAIETSIKSAFNLPISKELFRAVGEEIGNLPDFQDYGDFDKVNFIRQKAEKIAYLLCEISKNNFVVEHEQEFVSFFKSINFAKFDYEILYGVFDLLIAMPQRNYLPLLKTIFADERFISNKKEVMKLLKFLTALNNHYFPTEFLNAFSSFVIANPEKKYNLLIQQMVKIYESDNKDPILELIMTYPNLTYSQLTQILNISAGIDKNRDKIRHFLFHLLERKKLESFLKCLVDSTPNIQQILKIISKGHGLNRKPGAMDYEKLAILMAQIPVNELELLAGFYQTTPASAEALLAALIRLQSLKPRNFQDFLLEFERAPFGERSFKDQFSTTEVERVINQSKDLINNTPYPDHYRRQLMESSLLVNEIGEILPVYHNKSAKDLTNAEIKALFADLKAKKIPGLTPFQNRLMALGLMREAMYRSTGEFPYSTQIIALIDGMMHPGDFISNIDTGQGKSLIDSMKAALLWLDSDRVDLTTSSLIDAKRDIANYGPFFKLLGIPYSKLPISSASSLETFQKNGINFSTSAQLSLFLHNARIAKEKLDNPDTVVSLVVNESDYTLLDDPVIYRFATPDPSTISYGQEWIYYAINEFVSSKEFIENERSTARNDIANLKVYLEFKAKDLKISGKIIHKFSDEQYLVWLESAITVNYILKENVDYVIPDDFEKKIVNGKEMQSKVIKVLMTDGKVSPDSTFGNGIQQLLYAHLNQKRGSNDFVIEPQNKTIISSNNKNLVDYYRLRKGFIWGSSGTVGSEAEIQELYLKYGFDFSKIEPHQKNQVKFNPAIFAPDEEAQFEQVISGLTADATDENTPPSLVFCKDIDTANRLSEKFKKRNPKHLRWQVYTGLGDEGVFVSNAADLGMITFTTPALGRNTNIPYDPAIGLRVWHTSVDSVRGMAQKSGRTGRQGSADEVNFIFNAQELEMKDYEQIQRETDRLMSIERSVHEELYNVLGYLLLKMSVLTQFDG